ncbi:MAG: histidine--tRNA ligase [Flavobacteriaceae bacterium]
MAKTPKALIEARKPRGFADRDAGEVAAYRDMLARIAAQFEKYGFDPVETPAIEYTEALGKFLPDSDRPNEGVFSFQDDDEQWLSLRYDLTAPLARYVAENFDRLPKPYRSYRQGYVFRNEKPGPGRFRQFMQFDADTVGTASPAADAEICMLMADTLEAVGIARGDYVIRVNNRKVLDGVMEAIGLGGDEHAGTRLTVLRAIDKLDRLGIVGVKELLGAGRWDGGKEGEGDFTKGAGLSDAQIGDMVAYLSDPDWLPQSQTYADGHGELLQIDELVRAAGYDEGRIRVDPTVVRGLEYYTGPVFEAELTFETVNEKGEKARFGAVAGGGRYDGLVARFRGEEVPATGFSIGVSRLFAALSNLGKIGAGDVAGPVVVLVMDRDRIADYQRMASTLRDAGIRAEMYLGTSGMKAQMKYADRRRAPCVVIQGSNEREAGKMQIKDLIEGARLAQKIEGHEEWREARPAQVEVEEAAMVDTVRGILARHSHR